jgi:hypothetical protein
MLTVVQFKYSHFVFQCVIKSYLQWLQDSDYNPNCRFCNNILSDEQYGDCVRLTCYGEFIHTCNFVQN